MNLINKLIIWVVIGDNLMMINLLVKVIIVMKKETLNLKNKEDKA